MKIKFYLFLFLILLIHTAIYAQGLMVPAGANIISNNANIVLRGNLVNNGAIIQNKSTIVFAGTEQMLSGTSTTVFNNITVLSGSQTTIVAAGQMLKGILLSNGTLNVQNNLTLISTAAQTALIDGTGTGEVSGNLTLERYLSTGFGYKYISSPFKAATVNDYSDIVNLTASFPNFYRYNENQSTSGWVTYTDPASPVIPMHGYAANMGNVSAPKTIRIKGEVNNGSLILPLYNNNKPFTAGFNLVGNPYPSPIDWHSASGWENSNIDDAVYYFDASPNDQYTGTYSSYINGVSSNGFANNVIAAMQGFFVHVSDGSYPVAAELKINNSARINNLAPFFHVGGGLRDAIKPFLRLNAGFSNESTHVDPIVIYFDLSARPGFNKKTDALKLMNTDPQVPNLYAVSKDSNKLSITAIPVPDSSAVVPIALTIEKDGWIHFNASDIKHFPVGLKVYLSDTETKTIQNLQQNPQCRFYLNAGKHENRFSIVFSRKNLLPLQPPEDILENDVFKVYSSGANLFIEMNTPSMVKGTLTITNMLGQPVLQKVISFNGKHQLTHRFGSGVYIVSFYSDKGIFSKKLFISNG